MASKAAPQDMKDMQFTPEQFGPVDDFDVFLQGIIDAQESLLSGRIGALLYGSTQPEIANQVLNAAINLVGSDLTQRRLVRASANINEDTAKIITALGQIKKSFDDAANTAISRIVNLGVVSDSNGFSSGISVSSHFDDQGAGCWPLR